MAGDRDDDRPVGHRFVLLARNDPEPGTLKGTHSPAVGDARDSRQLRGYSDPGDLALLLRQGVSRSEIGTDRVSDVLQGFSLVLALRPATTQRGTPDGIPFSRLLERD